MKIKFTPIIVSDEREYRLPPTRRQHAGDSRQLSGLVRVGLLRNHRLLVLCRGGLLVRIRLVELVLDLGRLEPFGADMESNTALQVCP